MKNYTHIAILTLGLASVNAFALEGTSSSNHEHVSGAHRMVPLVYEHDGAVVPLKKASFEYEHDAAIVPPKTITFEYEHDGAVIPPKKMISFEYEHDGAIVPAKALSFEYEHDGAIVFPKVAAIEYQHDGAVTITIIGNSSLQPASIPVKLALSFPNEN